MELNDVAMDAIMWAAITLRNAYGLHIPTEPGVGRHVTPEFGQRVIALADRDCTRLTFSPNEVWFKASGNGKAGMIKKMQRDVIERAHVICNNTLEWCEANPPEPTQTEGK